MIEAVSNIVGILLGITLLLISWIAIILFISYARYRMREWKANANRKA